MVPCVDVGVRMIDIWVATCVLRVQAVGPAIREGSWRWEAALGQHMVRPECSVRMIEGHRARGKVWVDRDRWKARTGLGWIGAVPY